MTMINYKTSFLSKKLYNLHSKFYKFYYWFIKSKKQSRKIHNHPRSNLQRSISSKPFSPQGAGKKGIMRQNELGLYSNIPSLNVPRIDQTRKGLCQPWLAYLPYVPSLFKKMHSSTSFSDIIENTYFKYLKRQENLRGQQRNQNFQFSIYLKQFLITFLNLISDILIKRSKYGKHSVGSMFREGQKRS